MPHALRHQILASALPPTNCLASRQVHSRSSSPRGRAAIKASASRRKTLKGSPRPAASGPSPQQRKSSQPWPSLADTLRRAFGAGSTASSARGDARRSNSSPQPSASGADEPEQIFIPRDSPRHSSHSGEQQSSSNTSYKRRSADDLFASIFGSRSQGQHRQAPYQEPPKQPDWPSWLPPRPTPPPPHPIVTFLKSDAKGSGGFTNRQLLLGGVLVAGGLYYVTHLEQVPYTGRLRFKDVGPDQELQMGQEAFMSTLQQCRGRVLRADHPYSVASRRVALRLLKAAEDLHGLNFDNVEHGDVPVDHNDRTYARDSVRSTKWQVYVIHDPQQNAFVLPGGQIFVFSGILPLCQNEDGLATVLGHEIAHKLCSHSAEKASGYKIIVSLSFLLAWLGVPPTLTAWPLNLLMSLPNSRKLEQEADDLGLKLMSRACFDPEEASKFWGRMSASKDESDAGDGDAFGAILSTHPLSSKRMQTLQEALPAARNIRTEAGCPDQSTRTRFGEAFRGFSRSPLSMQRGFA